MIKITSCLARGLSGSCLSLVGRGGGDFYSSNRSRIHYKMEGAGEPVVLIHGITRTVEADWIESGMFQALSANYHVMALDCRGHGRSDKPHSRDAYGVKMLDDVLGLQDHLRIKQAHLPVLALIGSKDPAFPSVDQLRRRIEGMRVKVFSGEDHITILRHSKLAQEIDDFLQSIGSPH